MVEWMGPDVHGGIKNVDVKAGKVETDLDTFEGALLNIIPAQQAGAIALDAGLADDKGFCPIDPDFHALGHGCEHLRHRRRLDCR